MRRTVNILPLLAVVVAVPVLTQYGTILLLLAGVGVGDGDASAVLGILLGAAVLLGAALLVLPLLRVWPIPRRTAVVGCLLCLAVAAVGLASSFGLPGAAGLRRRPLARLLSPSGLGLSIVGATVLLLSLREPRWDRTARGVDRAGPAP